LTKRVRGQRRSQSLPLMMITGLRNDLWNKLKILGSCQNGSFFFLQKNCEGVDKEGYYAILIITVIITD
jgi:hypothetical protein